MSLSSGEKPRAIDKEQVYLVGGVRGAAERVLQRDQTSPEALSNQGHGSF